MAKVSPQGRKRRARVEWDVVFTDSLNPEQPIPMRLRKLGKMETVAVLDMAAAKNAELVTGYGIPGSHGYIEPTPLPPIDGEAVIVSESAIQVASFLFRAQVAEEGDRYSIDELLSFMVSDELCDLFSEEAQRVGPDEDEKPDPKASKGSTVTSSDTASTGEPQATPTSSPSSATPSGASTKGPEKPTDS